MDMTCGADSSALLSAYVGGAVTMLMFIGIGVLVFMMARTTMRDERERKKREGKSKGDVA